MLLSAAIVVFFAGHLALSLRGAILQDDRFAWRMFHNVGFSQVKYVWVKADGTTRTFRPKKESMVARAHLYLMPRGRSTWKPTYYSEGTTRVMVENYARHMGETQRPEWAVAFRAILTMRINDEKEGIVHTYEYPELAP